jgi:hypothetical protein
MGNEKSISDSPGLLPGPEYKRELVWRNIIIFIVIHTGAVYGFLAEKSSWSSIILSEIKKMNLFCDMK